jgi:predicted TIM-barrel fold metal-dependent hydrolase
LRAELWTDCHALPGIAERLRGLPVPLVIDHTGGAPIRSRQAQRLTQACPFPHHEALLQANPERLLWGSDWTHLRVTPAPDAQQLLAVFRRWTASDVLASKSLVSNPAALYA